MTNTDEITFEEAMDYTARRKAQIKRQNDHIKQNYERVSATLPNGTIEKIKAHGYSVNAFINECVLNRLADLDNPNKQKEIKMAAVEDMPEVFRADKSHENNEVKEIYVDEVEKPTEGSRKTTEPTLEEVLEWQAKFKQAQAEQDAQAEAKRKEKEEQAKADSLELRRSLADVILSVGQPLPEDNRRQVYDPEVTEYLKNL